MEPKQTSAPSWKDSSAPPQTAPSPQAQFATETEARIQRREKVISVETVDFFTTGRGATDSRFVAILKYDPATQTKDQHTTSVRQFIEGCQQRTIAGARPLFTSAELQANPATAHENIQLIEDNLLTIRNGRFEQAIQKAIYTAIEHHRKAAQPSVPPLQQQPLPRQQQQQQQQQPQQQQQQQQQQQPPPPQQPKTDEAAQLLAKKIRGELEDILRPNTPLKQADIFKWIEAGLGLPTEQDRLVEKLKNTGLIRYSKRTSTDPETGQDTASYKIYPGEKKSGYFGGLRTASFAAWGITIAASAFVLAVAPVGAGGLAVALGMISAFNAVNMGAQAALKKFHTNTFTNTWKEIQNELSTLDPKRAPALAGLMYLLVDKYSPIILFKNQTQLGQWGQPSSTKAVLEHLKEASAAALNNIAGTTEGYHKGVDAREKLTLAKNGLEQLEKRWGWHWDASTWWASTLTTTSGLGFLGFGASAFL